MWIITGENLIGETVIYAMDDPTIRDFYTYPKKIKHFESKLLAEFIVLTIKLSHYWVWPHVFKIKVESFI